VKAEQTPAPKSSTKFDEAATTLNEKIDFSEAYVDDRQRTTMVAHSVRLPRDLTERLFAEAERRGVTPSEVIRDLIDSGLSHRPAVVNLDSDGWETVPGPHGVDGLHVRVQTRDGRLVITGVHLHSAEEITGTTLRAVSLARIEALVNGQLYEEYVALMSLEPRPALSRPGREDPDEFYLRVAHAYQEYAARTKAPASAIAQEAGVPVGTAQGWVREARRRGHLPPGRRGRVG
jgi:hypothetical protein